MQIKIYVPQSPPPSALMNPRKNAVCLGFGGSLFNLLWNDLCPHD